MFQDLQLWLQFFLEILRHKKVFKPCLLSRQSLDTFSFPPGFTRSYLAEPNFSIIFFTFSFEAYSIQVIFWFSLVFFATMLFLACWPFLSLSQINTTGRVFPFSLCLLFFFLLIRTETFSLRRNAVT